MSETLQTGAVQNNVRYGYGGFWWRFLAAVIDAIILSVAAAIITPLFLIVPILLPIAPLIIDAGYHIILESSPSQGTLGKMICRLKVADMEGRRISPGKAALRYICKWLSTILLFIGYLLVFFNKRKQALHDMMASTVVLRVQEDRTFSDPIAGYHAQQQAYQPQYPAQPQQPAPPQPAVTPPPAPAAALQQQPQAQGTVADGPAAPSAPAPEGPTPTGPSPEGPADNTAQSSQEDGQTPPQPPGGPVS